MIESLTPVSAVADCHCEGVYSFVIDNDRRVFYIEDWTTLAANDFGDAVGFHNHHRDIEIQPLFGEILNIEARLVLAEGELATGLADKHPYDYAKWEWDSSLRGGKGRFLPVESDFSIGKTFKTTHLCRATPPIFLKRSQLHTVKQLTKSACWLVTESGKSSGASTQNWSRRGLKTWHRGKDWYRVLSPAEMSEKWKQVRNHCK